MLCCSQTTGRGHQELAGQTTPQLPSGRLHPWPKIQMLGRWSPLWFAYRGILPMFPGFGEFDKGFGCKVGSDGTWKLIITLDDIRLKWSLICRIGCYHVLKESLTMVFFIRVFICLFVV